MRPPLAGLTITVTASGGQCAPLSRCAGADCAPVDTDETAVPSMSRRGALTAIATRAPSGSPASGFALRRTSLMAPALTLGLLLSACETGGSDTVAVPSVEAGTTVGEATAVLEDAGLSVLVDRDPCPSSVTCDDDVTGTTPRAGTTMEAGSQVTVHHGAHQVPPATPTPPFILQCALGENSVSGTHDVYGDRPTFARPEGVAGEVLAAHPTWGAAADGVDDPVNVAIYNEAGDIKGLLLAQRWEDGWFLSAVSHCYDTNLYR